MFYTSFDLTLILSNAIAFTGVGINTASKVHNRCWIRFSNISDIICISGGYQDLLPGFYQVFIFSSPGVSRFQRGNPSRHLWRKNNENYINSSPISISSFTMLALPCYSAWGIFIWNFGMHQRGGGRGWGGRGGQKTKNTHQKRLHIPFKIPSLKSIKKP